MEKGVVSKKLLVNIGNAIRQKAGNTEKYYLSEIPSVIADLESLEELFDKKLSSITIRSQTLPAYCLYQHTELEELYLPNVTKIEQNVLAGNTQVQTLILPKVTSMSDNALSNVYGLQTVDLYKSAWIGNTAFMGTNLSTLILRSPTLIPLTSTQVFNNTPIIKGIGHIYVPENLVDSYKAATNWYAFQNQIYSIEDYIS